MDNDNVGTKLFILYDARACGAVGTDYATVLVSCDSMAEAEGYKGDFGQMACYSYDIQDENDMKAYFGNETWEWDFYG